MINLGMVSSPFGILGEVKIIANNINLDKVFKPQNKVYINNNCYIIQSVRYHKNHYLLKFNGLNSINDLDAILKKNIYFNKSDLKENNFYFYEDLMEMEVFDGSQNLGKVSEILLSKNTIYLKVSGIIIPMVSKYLEKVDITKKIIYVKFSEELRI